MPFEDREIGTIDKSGSIQQFKLLGIGLKGDIGAAIAIELEGETFIPLHDLTGHLIALITTEGTLAESYPMEAFGREESPIHSRNPWRFNSKRHEGTLVFFGRRFYDPTLGRWLTPDPAGFQESANLYLYVLNSPLSRLDLFGLYAEQYLPPRIEIPFSTSPPLHYFTQVASPGSLAHLKAYINGVEADIVVACGNMHQLQFSAEELTAGTFNLLDHMHEVMPSQGRQVCLITAKNGIMNNRNDHLEFCKSIVSKHPEGTLFISLYNPTEGLLSDIKRVNLEKKEIETSTVCLERQFMVALAEQIHQINPDAHWADYLHSEGGLITRRAIDGMTPEQQELMKKHLLITAFGPAKPLSKTAAFQVVNIYSEKDHVTKWFASKERNDPEYDIRIVPCISLRSERVLWIADHAFNGSTYQDALRETSDKIRAGYGFYAPQDQ